VKEALKATREIAAKYLDLDGILKIAKEVSRLMMDEVGRPENEENMSWGTRCLLSGLELSGIPPSSFIIREL